MAQTCGSCRYFRAFECADEFKIADVDDGGECRRVSPVVATHLNQGAVATWPAVDTSDWCGEWANLRGGPNAAAKESETPQ